MSGTVCFLLINLKNNKSNTFSNLVTPASCRKPTEGWVTGDDCGLKALGLVKDLHSPAGENSRYRGARQQGLQTAACLYVAKGCILALGPLLFSQSKTLSFILIRCQHELASCQEQEVRIATSGGLQQNKSTLMYVCTIPRCVTSLDCYNQSIMESECLQESSHIPSQVLSLDSLF